MARVVVRSEGLARVIASFNGVEARAKQNWGRTAYSEGARAATEIARRYNKRSGALARSYGHRVEMLSRLVRLEVGTIQPGSSDKVLSYAAAQEFGATIRPRNRQYLTIPLAAAKTAAGVARGSARDYPNTFIAKGIIFQRQAGGPPLPLFKLAKQVKIKGTGIATAAVLDAHRRIESRVAEDFERALLEP